MLYGRGAGALPTGSAIVSDVIFAIKHSEYFYSTFDNSEKGNKQTKFVEDFISKYYFRLSVKDATGVLSKISGVFSKLDVSIKEVKQICSEDGKAQVIVITHPCKESMIKKAITKFNGLDEVYEVKGMVRIED